MDENDKKYTRILNGMFCGITESIEKAEQSLEKEIRYGASQQGFSYDALVQQIKESTEKLLTEIKYLAQQNIDIYDYSRKEHAKMQESILKAMEVREEVLVKALDARIAAITVPVAQIDYDMLAEKVVSLLKGKPSEETAEAAEHEGTERTETATPEYFDDSAFAYDVLAEKIATIMPEPDYDLLADKIVASLPHADAETIAEQVAALVHNDPEAIAGEVADQILPTDYDLIGEKLAAVLEEHGCTLGAETEERLAQRIAELLRGDERDLERIAEETGVTPLEELAAAAEEPEPAPEPEPVPQPAPAPQPKPAPAPAPQPKAVPVPVVEDESKMVRYKRSFVAKIVGSDEDVKGYYSDLKNAILSYGKVRSQINWTNDRFSVGNDAVIKIGMRGRTLVMYLALDPSEFPETVYHQKFAGDTKMYEMTPMMVKIKTKAAVKKATRLIDLCLERFGAVKEEREPVDYAAQYFFRTDEELLAEGLIKTAIVDRSDLDF